MSAQLLPGIAALIAGIALLPPLGGMLTGAMGKTGAMVLRSAVVVLGVVVLALTIEPEQGQIKPVQKAQSPTSEQQANTPEGKIAAIVEGLGCKPISVELTEKALTEWTDEQVKRIQQGEQISSGEFLVQIKYKSLEGFSGKQTKKFVYRKAMEIMQALSTKPEFSSIVSYMLMPHANLEDKYGNTKLEQVAKFVLSRDVAQKINWDNMYEEKFTSIVQSDGQLWLHPAMR